jgi:hypothetical protein
MIGGIKNIVRSYLVPLVSTIAAFGFWKNYSPGRNYWWIVIVILILSGHYYYYFRKILETKKISYKYNNKA